MRSIRVLAVSSSSYGPSRLPFALLLSRAFARAELVCEIALPTPGSSTTLEPGRFCAVARYVIVSDSFGSRTARFSHVRTPTAPIETTVGSGEAVCVGSVTVVLLGS